MQISFCSKIFEFLRISAPPTSRISIFFFRRSNFICECVFMNHTHFHMATPAPPLPSQPLNHTCPHQRPHLSSSVYSPPQSKRQDALHHSPPPKHLRLFHHSHFLRRRANRALLASTIPAIP